MVFRCLSSSLAKYCLLVSCLAAPPFISATQADDSADKLEALRKTMAEVKAELERVKNNRSELLSELEGSENKIGELSEQVDKLKGELGDKKNQMEDLRTEKEAAISAKKQHQQAAGQHIRSAYLLGQQSHLKLLLNQQNPARASRNLKYLDYLVRSRSDKISAFSSAVQKINRIEPQIASAAAAIESNHQKLSQQRQSLIATQAERKRTLQRLEQAIASTDARLQALEQDRQQLQKLVVRIFEVTDEMDFSVPDTVAITKMKGRLPWPTKGKIAKRFGFYRVDGRLRWQGVLIDASEGEPVKAVHNGRVVFADYLRGQGLLIMIDHGSDYMSIYAHNQSLYKKVGDWVAAGEQIASVGNSGGQQTSQLYFELRHKLVPINPQGWLGKA